MFCLFKYSSIKKLTILFSSKIHTPRVLELNIGKVKQVASGGTMCGVLTGMY